MIKQIRCVFKRYQEEIIKEKLESAIRNNDLQSVQDLLQHPCLINLNKGFSRGHIGSKQKKFSYVLRVIFGFEDKKYTLGSRSALGLALNIQPNLNIVRALLDARNNKGGRSLNLNIQDGFGETDLSRIISSKIPFEERQHIINELLNSDDVHAAQQPVAKILRQMVCVSRKNIDLLSIKRLLYFIKNKSTFDFNFDLKWRSSSPQTLLDLFIYLHQSSKDSAEKNILEDIIDMIKDHRDGQCFDIAIKLDKKTAYQRTTHSKIIKWLPNILRKLKPKYINLKIKSDLKQANNYLHSLPDTNKNKTQAIGCVEKILQITQESAKTKMTLNEKLTHTWKEIIFQVNHPERREGPDD